ncbi:unnamed protein product [Moneuplotes crassus]|uniref:Uncharacterized protein n=1 Tax=Euplotes crassus TaxID=5936 RepID=A0AAD1X743_EUPCR|nr:unnamed protein product [Moneuplotes crassus]
MSLESEMVTLKELVLNLFKNLNNKIKSQQDIIEEHFLRFPYAQSNGTQKQQAQDPSHEVSPLESSEFVEMEATKEELAEVPEEPSNVASDAFQENSHPNCEKNQSSLVAHLPQEENSKGDKQAPSSGQDEDTEEEKAEFYFSCHERMQNDQASKDSKDSPQEKLLPSSLYSDNGGAIREAQSMPNLSKTTLNAEIDYDLASNKLNEISKTESDDLSPGSEKGISSGTGLHGFRWAETNVKPQPKFMKVLNSAKKPDLNRSDEFEAQDIINSINYLESHRATDLQPFDYQQKPSELKSNPVSPRNTLAPQSPSSTPFEYTFGKRNKKQSLRNPIMSKTQPSPAPIMIGEGACDSEPTMAFNSNNDCKAQSRSMNYPKISDSWKEVKAFNKND